MDWSPAIIQDVKTRKVLMLGYMNEEALEETKKSGKVTFYSRSKQRLWTKGETSENYLFLKEIIVDCDKDTLLIKAEPAGPACHTRGRYLLQRRQSEKRPFPGAINGNHRGQESQSI